VAEFEVVDQGHAFLLGVDLRGCEGVVLLTLTEELGNLGARVFHLDHDV